MPLAYELHAGDVIVVQGGDVRTLAAITPNVTYDETLVRFTFTDGAHALLPAGQYVHRLHPQDVLPSAALPAMPTTPVST